VEVTISIGLWKAIFSPIQIRVPSIEKMMQSGQSIGVKNSSNRKNSYKLLNHKKMNTQKLSAGYTGKIKTGSPKPKKKFDTPKPKMATPGSEIKKPRKRKDSTTPDKKSHTPIQNNTDEVPTWVRESSEKKPERKE